MSSLKDKLSETDRAYLAGLFDGEGTIGFYNYRSRHESTVMITNADPRVMSWLLDKTGYGNVHSRLKPEYRRRHGIHHWRICGKSRVQDFLEAVLPFLIIKKDQAVLLLQLWAAEQSGKNKITADVKNRRDSAVVMLKLLKTANLSALSPAC
jgi:hypothetical protein